MVVAEEAGVAAMEVGMINLEVGMINLEAPMIVAEEHMAAEEVVAMIVEEEVVGEAMAEVFCVSSSSCVTVALFVPHSSSVSHFLSPPPSSSSHHHRVLLLLPFSLSLTFSLSHSSSLLRLLLLPPSVPAHSLPSCPYPSLSVFLSTGYGGGRGGGYGGGGRGYGAKWDVSCGGTNLSRALSLSRLCLCIVMPLRLSLHYASERS